MSDAADHAVPVPAPAAASKEELVKETVLKFLDEEFTLVFGQSPQDMVSKQKYDEFVERFRHVSLLALEEGDSEFFEYMTVTLKALARSYGVVIARAQEQLIQNRVAVAMRLAARLLVAMV